jgi:hypothetical protein
MSIGGFAKISLTGELRHSACEADHRAGYERSREENGIPTHENCRWPPPHHRIGKAVLHELTNEVEIRLGHELRRPKLHHRVKRRGRNKGSG